MDIKMLEMLGMLEMVLKLVLMFSIVVQTVKSRTIEEMVKTRMTILAVIAITIVM